MKFNLPVHFKNLTVLSMATLMLGMGHPLELNTVELASTARTAVMASKMAKTLKPKEAQAKTSDKKAAPAAAKKTAAKTEKSPEKKEASADKDKSEVSPVIANAINKVDKAQQIGKVMGDSEKDKNTGVNCKDCSSAKEVADMKYGACTDKNNYLEGILDKHSSLNTSMGKLINQTINPNGLIKPTCVEMSIELGRSQFESGRFKGCTGDKINKASKLGSPCASERYVGMITNSFNLVASCMKDFIAQDESDLSKKLDVLAVYGMINIESGFIVNTVSSTGAGGIGQFTETAINDVNQHELSDVRTLLMGHDNPLCKDMAKQFLSEPEPIRADFANSCDRISVNRGNPVKNMIYTFAYLKGTKEDLNNKIFENSKFKDKFKKLSAADIQKIRRVMMVWSHNTGPSGITDPVKSLLRSKYKNVPVSNADAFIAQIDDALRAWPAAGNKGKDRRAETSKYYPKIAAKLSEIEQNAGGGSCLN